MPVNSATPGHGGDSPDDTLLFTVPGQWSNLPLGKMASELELLKSNREELVRKIRFVKPFLDRLLQYGEIVQEEYDIVVAERTPQDRARALLDVVGAKGRGAFRHFREHLKRVNPELEEVLHRCATHNLRLKLYCEVCEMLLCRHCHKEDHIDHRCTSLVADADALRREFTAFKRENRKLLAARKDESNICNIDNMQKRAGFRMKMLKEKFCAKVDEEYRWFLRQLEDGSDTTSDTQSVSSIADSGSVAGSEANDFIGWLSPISSPFRGSPRSTAVYNLYEEREETMGTEDHTRAPGPDTNKIAHWMSLKMHFPSSPPSVKEVIELCEDDEGTDMTEPGDLQNAQFGENESFADDETTTEERYIKEDKEPLILNLRLLVWKKQQPVQYSKSSTICPQGHRYMIL